MRPIIISPISLSGDKKHILISTPDDSFEIDSNDEIWKIIALCDGYNSLQTIAKQTGIKVDRVGDIIADLVDLKVVCDSTEQFLHFHNLSNNPARFWRDLTSEEISDHVNSAPLPIKDGEVFNLTVDTSTPVYTLGAARKSTRSFSHELLTKDQIGTLLVNSYSSNTTPVPSGGGLYPLKLYVLVTKDQSDLPKGYYEYDPRHDTLTLFSQGVDVEFLKHVYDSEDLPYNASVFIVIAADLFRQPHKYANRGYRFTLMECGAVAQNITLSCVEQGISSCQLGGAMDELLKKELQLDEPIYPLLSIAVGFESTDEFEDSSDLLYKLDTQMVGIKKAVRKVDVVSDIKADGFFFASALANAAPDEDAKSSYTNRFSFGVANSMPMAKVKAIAEAYERHRSGRIKIDFVGTAAQIKGLWLDPNKIAPMDNDQRERLGLQEFTPDTRLEWVSGTKYATKDPVLAPIDLVFYPVSEERYGRALVCDTSSSGTAASTSLEDAETRALLELIERDAIMRSWFEQKAPPRLDTSAIAEHWQRREAYWRSQGRDVHVLDMSVDGVDIIQVVIVGESFPDFANGCAAVIRTGPDSYNAALQKAFQEAEFALLSAVSIGRTRTRRAERVKSPIDHAEYYYSKQHVDEISWLWSGDLLAERLSTITTSDELKRKLDIVTFDLSEDSQPLKVARVLCESLIPINFGFRNDYFLHPAVKELDFNVRSQVIPHYFA